jgi:hypothetical protein
MLSLPNPCVDKRRCSGRIFEPQYNDNLGMWMRPNTEGPTVHLWENGIRACMGDEIKKSKAPKDEIMDMLHPEEISNADAWTPVIVASSESLYEDVYRSSLTNFVSAMHTFGHVFKFGRLARLTIKGLWQSNVVNNRRMWRALACFSNASTSPSAGLCFDVYVVQNMTHPQHHLEISLTNNTHTQNKNTLTGKEFSLIYIREIGCLSESIMYT